MCRQSRKKKTDKKYTHHKVNQDRCSKAALKEREDGKLTTSSGRVFHKLQTDTKSKIERRQFWEMKHESDES